MDVTDRDLIDVNDVAELIGSTPRHVRSLVEHRLIPHFKVGAKLRFDRAEVRTWIEAQRREVVS